MSPELDAPVVVITGATGPLGRVVAPRFARDGARLALVGRDHGRLAEIGERLGVASDRWMPVPGDLTVAGSASAVANAVTAQWGRIDVLLHLVGGWAGGTAVADLDHDEVRWMLDQHLWTTLHVAQAVVPGMVERGFGRVIAVSSPLAADPGPKGASYAVAKASSGRSRGKCRAPGSRPISCSFARSIPIASVRPRPRRRTPPGRLRRRSPRRGWSSRRRRRLR